MSTTPPLTPSDFLTTYTRQLNRALRTAAHTLNQHADNLQPFIDADKDTSFLTVDAARLMAKQHREDSLELTRILNELHRTLTT